MIFFKLTDKYKISDIYINHNNYLRVPHRCCELGGPVPPHWGGAPQNLMGGLCRNMGGAWGKLKMSLKNTHEGVHLIVKLLAISLEASKFTKNELLHTYFSRILARF